MAPSTNGSISAQFDKQQREVVNTFARAALAMRDAARVAEEFSNWFARVNNMEDIPPPPSFSLGSPTSDVVVSKKRKTEASPSLDENGKAKRVVKPRKARDKDAPRKPTSAYILFQNEVRKDVKNDHPKLNNTELLHEIRRLWDTVPEKEKNMYAERYEALKSKYDEEKAAYDAKLGITPEEKKTKKPTKKVAKITPAKGITISTSRAKDAAADSDPASPQDEEEQEQDEIEPEVDMIGEEDGDEDEGENSEVESEIESEPEPPKKKAKVDDKKSKKQEEKKRKKH